MPYNPQIHQSVIMTKASHTKLKQLAQAEKRTLQAQLELLIEQASAKKLQK